MTGREDTERVLGAYLAPDHDQLPDRVLEASLAQIARTPQRRAMRVPWRFPFMPALPRASALGAGALAAVVAVAGLVYVIGTGRGLGPAAQASPSPTPGTTLDSCGHELAGGLMLTAGCEYRTAFNGPTLRIVSDGNWIDGFQDEDGYDFFAVTGPAINTAVRFRMVRGVLQNPCDEGALVLAPSLPASAREYIDWLGRFIPDPRAATPVRAFGLQGWQFELRVAEFGSTPDPGCTTVSLNVPAPLPTDGLLRDSIVATGPEAVHVMVLDTEQGVLLAMLWPIDDPDSIAAGQAFLAGVSAAP